MPCAILDFRQVELDPTAQGALSTDVITIDAA